MLRKATTGLSALLVVACLLTVSPALSSHPLISNVTYYIMYDPLARSGYASITFNVDVNTTTQFSIQLVNPSYANASFLNATFSNPAAVLVPPLFNSSTGVIDFVANSSTTVNVYLLLYDLFQELTPGSYEAVLDFTMFRNTSFTSTITIPGVYQVIARRFDYPTGTVSVSYSANTTVITFSSPGLYHVILLVPMNQVSQPSSGAQTSPTPWWVWAVTALLAGTVAAALYYSLRRGRLEVETLPPKRLEEDDVVREIVLALGEAGEEGLRQSELVSITKRPKSSISRRVKRLLEEGYVEVERVGKYNVLKLTEKGVLLYKRLKK